MFYFIDFLTSPNTSYHFVFDFMHYYFFIILQCLHCLFFLISRFKIIRFWHIVDEFYQQHDACFGQSWGLTNYNYKIISLSYLNFRYLLYYISFRKYLGIRISFFLLSYKPNNYSQNPHDLRQSLPAIFNSFYFSYHL